MEIKTTPPTPGTVQFQPAVNTAVEGTTATITVRRVGGSLGAATVDYATGSGTRLPAAQLAVRVWTL